MKFCCLKGSWKYLTDFCPAYSVPLALACPWEGQEFKSTLALSKELRKKVKICLWKNFNKLFMVNDWLFGIEDISRQRNNAWKIWVFVLTLFNQIINLKYLTNFSRIFSSISFSLSMRRSRVQIHTGIVKRVAETSKDLPLKKL